MLLNAFSDVINAGASNKLNALEHRALAYEKIGQTEKAEIDRMKINEIKSSDDLPF
jgi:hypothetical protein